MSKDIENEIRCSFCGKTQDEVVRLVEGPGVYICDSCINFCSSFQISNPKELSFVLISSKNPSSEIDW